jgi:hypothetical protein
MRHWLSHFSKKKSGLKQDCEINKAFKRFIKNYFNEILPYKLLASSGVSPFHDTPFKTTIGQEYLELNRRLLCEFFSGELGELFELR